MQQTIQDKRIKSKANEVRSPTLQTVLMIEKHMEENSGEYKKTGLWKTLPKKVMWQTFQVTFDYLESIHKITSDKEGYIIYIWNPDLVRKYNKREDLEWSAK